MFYKGFIYIGVCFVYVNMFRYIYVYFIIRKYFGMCLKGILCKY